MLSNVLTSLTKGLSLMSTNIYVWKPRLAKFNTFKMTSAIACKKATKNKITQINKYL